MTGAAARPIGWVLIFMMVVGTGWEAFSHGPATLTFAGVTAIAVVGYQLVFGQAGALSLAQGAFFGIGAYAAGLMSVGGLDDLAVTGPAGVLAGMVAAALIALPVLRLGSHYFALATLVLAQLVHLVAVNWLAVTGGANGLYGIAPPQVFGVGLGLGWQGAAIAWGGVAFAIAVWMALLPRRRRIALSLLRADPNTAAATGIRGDWLRFWLFVAGAGMAGLAGSLQAHLVGVVSPAVTAFPVMVTILAAAVVGGRGSVLGAVLGAVLLVHLPEWVRPLEEHYLLAHGALLLIAILLIPEGIAGLLRRQMEPISSERSVPDDKVLERLSNKPGAALDATGLRKRFGGVVALDGVDLSVAPGEIVGLIGPNGSGKTTALNLLSGFEVADGGSVRLDGEEIAHRSPAARARLGLGRTFQHPTIPADLGGKAVFLAAPSPDAASIGDVVLARLAGERDASPGSHDLARALANKPTVLLLDEPAAGLSSEEQRRLAGLLRDLSSNGLAIVVVEHTMDFLSRVADRLVCLSAGQVLAEGFPETVLKDEAVRRLYLGETP